MTDAPTDDPGADPSVSPLAARVGSDESIAWLKRATMGLALAFLVGAVGYFVGVRTTLPPSNEVDVGFLRDMTDHHDQAVTMALMVLDHGSDPVVRDFAMEILLFQRQELGRIQNFQDERGVVQPEYDLDRTTMEWMAMPTPLRSMVGMASEAQLAQLEAARGADADRLFLTLMQAHHLGGAHMAEHAAEHAADPKIREMADGITRNQRVEVREYQQVLERRLGGAAPR